MLFRSPYGWFDFCVVPEHDRPPRLPNLLMTKGVLNSIDSVGGEHRPDQGLILVGGESAHFHWSDDKVCAQVRQILAKDATHWSLSSSRRTPHSFAGKARAMAEDRLRWMPVEETKPGWVNEQLQRCGKVWITQDSVSMLYEALTAGCQVGVIELERNGSSRVSRGIESLVQDRWVTLFSKWKSDGGLTTLPVDFNEAERCAQWLLDQGPFDF